MLEALRNGEIAQVKPAKLARAKDESLQTIYRRIKQGRIQAKTDPVTKRLYIPAVAALAYLDGEPYQHDHMNKAAIDRMAKARAGKQEI